MWRKIMQALNSVRVQLTGFFPFRLLLLHLRQDFVLILFWLVLFGFITGSLGKSYGLQYLFIFPEYLGKVNYLSYLILGLGFGGFVMAFNISGYIIHSRRFPFLATLSKPFMKFCLNNSLIPLAFLGTYAWQNYNILVKTEELQPLQVLGWTLSFAFGSIMFVAFSLGYFFQFNKDLAMLFGVDPASRQRRIALKKESGKLKYQTIPEQDIEVRTYLRNPFRISRCRPARHYGQLVLLHVFRQHHLNGALFEIGVIITLIILGLFRELPVFQVPAGAAFFLLFTMLLMMFSAVHFLLGRYSMLFFILAALGLNEVSKQEMFSVKSYAYGLDYSNPLPYHPDSVLAEIRREKPFQEDIQHHKKILRLWRQKNRKHHRYGQKPRAVFIACSGGGMKAALWAFLSIQHADSTMDGRLMDHTVLITGSSGGMIGAAHYRELYYRAQLGLGNELFNSQSAELTARDLLNPVAISIALNDFLIRWQKFRDGTRTYPKDRGYAFEKQLNENTDQAFSRRLGEYREPEASAMIPMMIFTPTILNDAKRLIISPQPMSFMSNRMPDNRIGHIPGIEDLEFSRLFKNQGADNLWFSTAVRMNASFPFILPSVTLPTRPELEIGDAGIRDNFGVRTSLQYLFHLKDWFEQNTAGIIIIRIHDSRGLTYDPNDPSGLFSQFFAPVNSIANNLNGIHQQENDQLLQYAGKWYRGRIDVIDFRLSDILQDEISMSLHLTAMEKQKLRNALEHPRMREAITKLRALLTK